MALLRRVAPPVSSPSAVVLVNHATGLDDAAVVEAAAAFTEWGKTFAVYWGRTPLPVVASRTVGPTQWPVYLLDHSDQEDALGYHDLTSRVPYGRVFVADCKADNVSWTVDADHEIREMDADPWCNLCSDSGAGQMIGWEPADPVEADEYGREVGGVRCTDFVTPAWFVPQLGGPVDATGALTKPYTLAPGGYASVFRGGKWSQITRRLTPLAAGADPFEGMSVRSQRSHRILRRAGGPINVVVTDGEAVTVA